MQHLSSVLVYLLLFTLLFRPITIIAATLPEDQVYPGTTWQSRTPAQVGLNTAKLDEFRIATGNKMGVIIKDGYLVYSWGDATAKFDWASARKPVYSTMLLFALKEDKISSVDEPIELWGWPVTEADRSITFRHLANMVSGYALPEDPGQVWGYNDYAISLYVHTLFDRVFQQTPNEAANNTNRLQPLKFQDGNIFGSRLGYGLRTTPRDFARIGWLWLNKGYWNGRQLLPSSYFDEYFVPQVPSNMPRTMGGTIDDYLGVGTHGGGTNQTSKGPGVYGFNLWHNRGKRLWPDIPEDVYQANGHWNGEVLTVLPSQNMVVAWKGNSATPETFPAEMNRLLKILTSSPTSSPSPEPSPSPTPTPSPTNATCNGVAATIVGTESDNFITGTEGPDVIAGLGGSDTINGLGGSDIICGGTGNDTVNGGDEADKIFGEGGSDTIYGGNGHDTLNGGGGHDKLYGDAKDDKLVGGSGDDIITGGTHNNGDTCNGGAHVSGDSAQECESISNVP